jgi:hypothetical protein
MLVAPPLLHAGRVRLQRLIAFFTAGEAEGDDRREYGSLRMALLSRIPRFPILGILEIGGIDDEEPKSVRNSQKRPRRNGGSPGLAASIHAK